MFWFSGVCSFVLVLLYAYVFINVYMFYKGFRKYSIYIYFKVYILGHFLGHSKVIKIVFFFFFKGRDIISYSPEINSKILKRNPHFVSFLNSGALWFLAAQLSGHRGVAYRLGESPCLEDPRASGLCGAMGDVHGTPLQSPCQRLPVPRGKEDSGA